MLSTDTQTNKQTKRQTNRDDNITFGEGNKVMTMSNIYTPMPFSKSRIKTQFP